MTLRAAMAFASGCTLAAAGLSAHAPPRAAAVLERFLERHEPPLAAYTAVRRLEARNGRFKVAGLRVEVIRRYARIAGVRVPVSLDSVVQVRLAGRSRFHTVVRLPDHQQSAITNRHPLFCT